MNKSIIMFNVMDAAWLPLLVKDTSVESAKILIFVRNVNLKNNIHMFFKK